MPSPTRVSAYPPAMLAAIEQAHTTGELRIPTKNPLAMRFQFNALRAALRKEGRAQMAEELMFTITETECVLVLKEKTPLFEEIANALTQKPQTHDDLEAAMDRILGGVSSLPTGVSNA